MVAEVPSNWWRRRWSIKEIWRRCFEIGRAWWQNSEAEYFARVGKDRASQLAGNEFTSNYSGGELLRESICDTL